ncbi:cation:proton antiporter [Fictibacillus aquaticus]|uniref:Sodium:proton antiporter n=1 Tax=Fictibacillus aquaticus TaxID=2021314 RepID=A0A235FEM9_9BACL|nr:cation:proton antiporter [Fictibacillus aquaticus]OYD59599.1 sodium:proton antiporter [Fictibacillus aquaticus]
MHHSFNVALMLLAIAVGVTALAKKTNRPYPIALVIVGAVIGLVPISGLEGITEFIAEGEIFQFIIISLLLPVLLGEASLKLPFSHLKHNAVPVFVLALAGTLCTFFLVAAGMNIGLGLSLQTAFVFAALMSATDPVSVLSIFKTLGVNKKLSTIIEGESLFNDGIAVVLFMISSVYLTEFLQEGPAGIVSSILVFVKVAAGGLLVGGALGYIFSKLTSWYDDYPLEILFSLVLFYGSFSIAEAFHVSGVIAVVTAGIIFGNYGAKIGMSPTTKVNIHSFWDVLALLANSVVFFLVGLEIAYIDIANKWGLIAGSIVIVLLSRATAVYGTLLPVKGIPMHWKHVLNWGGLKGSLSIALALSLPADFSGREDLIVLSFSVVFFSLLVQGTTISLLIEKLKLKGAGAEKKEYDLILSRIHRYRSALKRLGDIEKDLVISPVVHSSMQSLYEQKVSEAKSELENKYKEHPEWRKEQERLAGIEALYAEYAAVERLLRKEMIPGDLAEEELEKILDKIEGMNDEKHD